MFNSLWSRLQSSQLTTYTMLSRVIFFSMQFGCIFKCHIIHSCDQIFMLQFIIKPYIYGCCFAHVECHPPHRQALSPLRAGPQQALLWASFQTYFLLLQLSDTFCVGTSGVACKVQKGGACGDCMARISWVEALCAKDNGIVCDVTLDRR